MLVSQKSFHMELRPQALDDTQEDFRVCNIDDTEFMCIIFLCYNCIIMYIEWPQTGPLYQTHIDLSNGQISNEWEIYVPIIVDC